MKLAITFNDRLSLERAWTSSGIAQNLKFYYDLFELLGHQVSWLTFTEYPIEFNGKEYQTLTREQLKQEQVELDVIFEGGMAILASQQAEWRTELGCKVVSLCCGHQYYRASEGVMLAGDIGMNSFIHGYDQMWLLPHHANQAPWLSTVHACPAIEVPYIWEPEFVRLSANFKDTVATPNVMVMEPNLSVAKNALIPMVAIQHLYDIAPELFVHAYVFNAENFANAEYFLYNFVTTLPVLRAETNRVFFEPRRRFHQVFKQADILLSHQFYNGMNNLHNEAIYAGLPLVHNSPFYREVGYFYSDYQAKQAADCMAQASQYHNQRQAASAGQAFLARFSIHNPAVQERFDALLNRLAA